MYGAMKLRKFFHTFPSTNGDIMQETKGDVLI